MEEQTEEMGVKPKRGGYKPSTCDSSYPYVPPQQLRAEVNAEEQMQEPAVEVYWVDVGYACGGICVEEGVVTECAPIFNWAKGKPWDEVRRWKKILGVKLIEGLK